MKTVHINDEQECGTIVVLTFTIGRLCGNSNHPTWLLRSGLGYRGQNILTGPTGESGTTA